MKKEDFASAMTDALGEPLLQFSQALKANTAATQAFIANQQKVGGDTAEDADADEKPAVQGDSKFSALDSKVDVLAEQIEALTKTVTEAVNTPAADTTPGEEEHLGDSGKYTNLL